MGIAIALLALVAIAGGGGSKKSTTKSSQYVYTDKKGVVWKFSVIGPLWTGTSTRQYAYPPTGAMRQVRYWDHSGLGRQDAINQIDRFVAVSEPV